MALRIFNEESPNSRVEPLGSEIETHDLEAQVLPELGTWGPLIWLFPPLLYPKKNRIRLRGPLNRVPLFSDTPPFRVYSKLQKVGTWFKDNLSWDSLWHTLWGMGIRMLQLVGVYCRVYGLTLNPKP